MILTSDCRAGFERKGVRRAQGDGDSRFCQTTIFVAIEIGAVDHCKDQRKNPDHPVPNCYKDGKGDVRLHPQNNVKPIFYSETKNLILVLIENLDAVGRLVVRIVSGDQPGKKDLGRLAVYSLAGANVVSVIHLCFQRVEPHSRLRPYFGIFDRIRHCILWSGFTRFREALVALRVLDFFAFSLGLILPRFKRTFALLAESKRPLSRRQSIKNMPIWELSDADCIVGYVK